MSIDIDNNFLDATIEESEDEIFGEQGPISLSKQILSFVIKETINKPFFLTSSIGN
jgi:hypothetical protein